MTYPYETVTLRARDLFGKFGFADGDLVDEMLWDTDLEWGVRPSYKAPWSEYSLEHETLFAVIERFLLPALPVPVRWNRWNTNHNPARAHHEDDHLEDAVAAIEVTVRVADIVAIAREIAARKPTPEAT
ncbi:MAG TPA: hypothetical protein VF534_01725 [Paraburkholderia sp.]